MTNQSRAEPFAGREDVSLPAHAADLGACRHKEAGSAMEPAKSRETTTMTAKLPSRALPQSLEAAKRSIIPLSTTLANWQTVRSRKGAVRPPWSIRSEMPASRRLNQRRMTA